MNEEGIIKVYNWFKKLLSSIAVSFSCLIIIFLLFSTILSNLNANNDNYRPLISLYTIVSPSMEPVIEVYDVVVNVKVTNANDVEVGDIITFKSKSSISEGMTITHRVVEKIENSNGQVQFKTQGDNNNSPDSGYVDLQNIIGKEIFIIPALGNLQFLLSSSKGWMFLILLPISYFIIKDIFELIDLLGLKKKVNKVIKEENKNDNEIREAIRKEELQNRLKLKDNSVEQNVIRPTAIENEHSKMYENLKTELNAEMKAKIQEYDKKITELDNMIKKLENNYTAPKKIKISEENYLKERKIKVIKEEIAKKKKR